MIHGSNNSKRRTQLIRALIISIAAIIFIYTFLYIFVISENEEESETDEFTRNDLPATFIIETPKVKPDSTSFTLVMMSVKNRFNHYYYRRSLEDKHDYAKRHGYGLIAQTVPLDVARDVSWSKIKLVQNYLFSSKTKTHWIWLIDLDTLVMNPNITLESIVDPSYDMIISEDCNGLNTGSILFRNTEWNRLFLDELYELNNVDQVDQVDTLWEQAAMIHLYNKNKEQYTADNRIKVVHQKTFNSFPEETTKLPKCKLGRFEEGDFVVHFGGASAKDAIFDRYYKSLHQIVDV